MKDVVATSESDEMLQVSAGFMCLRENWFYNKEYREFKIGCS
jgi:hypothetical protein